MKHHLCSLSCNTVLVLCRKAYAKLFFPVGSTCHGHRMLYSCLHCKATKSVPAPVTVDIEVDKPEPTSSPIYKSGRQRLVTCPSLHVQTYHVIFLGNESWLCHLLETSFIDFSWGTFHWHKFFVNRNEICLRAYVVAEKYFLLGCWRYSQSQTSTSWLGVVHEMWPMWLMPWPASLDTCETEEFSFVRLVRLMIALSGSHTRYLISY